MGRNAWHLTVTRLKMIYLGSHSSGERGGKRKDRDSVEKLSMHSSGETKENLGES